MKIAKIQSSGKTGTESAALFAAQQRGIPITGYRPLNSACEYENIKETPSSKEEQCVIWNVRDAHATLFLGDIDNSKMASLAFEVAENYQRPHNTTNNINDIIYWLNQLGDEITLNVIGPSKEEDNASEISTKYIVNKILAHFDAIYIL